MRCRKMANDLTSMLELTMFDELESVGVDLRPHDRDRMAREFEATINLYFRDHGVKTVELK